MIRYSGNNKSCSAQKLWQTNSFYTSPTVLSTACFSPLFLCILIRSCSSADVGTLVSGAHSQMLCPQKCLATGQWIPTRLNPSDGLDLESIHSYQMRVLCRDRHTMAESKMEPTSCMEEVPRIAAAQTVSLSMNQMASRSSSKAPSVHSAQVIARA